MAAITSAGAGSGLQLESIITATLNAKRASFESSITPRESTLQTTLSGVGQLKSALSTFLTSSQALSAADAFNLRKINITQSTDNPVLSVSSDTGISNGSYNVTVSQLAQGSRLESNSGSFSSASQVIATTDGQLTFNAGSGKTFTVNVAAGTTLQGLRSLINGSGSNFGLSANIINSNGESKLVLDSAVSGSGNNLTISASTSELKIFDTSDPSSKMTQTQAAQDASISIDGTTVTSSSNVFDNVIQGTKLTVLRTSDKDTSGTAISNKVAITTDTKGVQDKITAFVNAYNTLASSLDSLSKRPSIVAGQRQNDGGLLAGDSTVRGIRNYMFQALSTPSSTAGTYSTIFDVGVKMDNSGMLSVDSTKLTNALTTNFDQVGALFGGSTGLAASMTTELTQYTQTAGSLDQRSDGINTELRQITQKRTDFEASMVTYETALRKQYGDLDSLLVKMKNSASALTALTSTTSSA